MKIEEILALVPDDKKDSAKKTLEEHGAVNADKVGKWIKGDDGDAFIKRITDVTVTKALQSYEKKFMDEKFPEILESEINKRYPAQTPEQKKIIDLENKLKKSTEDIARKEQIAKAQKILGDLGLPAELASRYHGMTDDETSANISGLKTLIEWRDKAVKAKDDEWLAKGGKPGGGDKSNGKTMTRSEFDALDFIQRAEITRTGITLTD